MTNREELKHPSWIRLAAVGTIGVAALGLTRIGLNWDGARRGSDISASLVSIENGARGRSVPSIYEGTTGDSNQLNVEHTLDLNGTETNQVCYPTADKTVRMYDDDGEGDGDTSVWYRIDFNEVDTAIREGAVVDRKGKPVSELTVSRLGSFASDWPIDPLGRGYTWVNAVRASAQSKEK